MMRYLLNNCNAIMYGLLKKNNNKMDKQLLQMINS